MNKPINNSDEIDLVSLFHFFSTGLKRVLLAFLKFFRKVILHYYKLISIICFLTITIGVSFAFFQGTVLESGMIIQCDYYDVAVSERLFESLNQLAKDKSSLKKKLKINEDIANSIVAFEFKPFNPDFLSDAFVKNGLKELASKMTDNITKEQLSTLR